MATAQILYAPPPQSGVVISPVRYQDPRKEKHKMKLRSLGIAEVVLGSLSCLMSLITLSVAATSWYRGIFTYISSGIWCGMFAIISGSLGICAKKNPTTCMYNANLAMSIVASIFTCPQIIISIIAGVNTMFGYRDRHHMHDDNTMTAFNFLLAVNGLTTLVICIVHSAFCCAGVCCRKNRLPPTQVVYTAAPPSQQFVQLPNGQYALVMNQPQNYVTPMQGGTSIPGVVMAPQHPEGPVVAPTVDPTEYMNVTPGQGPVTVPEEQAVGAIAVTETPGSMETKLLDPDLQSYP